MAAVNVSKWYHSNRYAASEECEQCGGVVRHAYWCPTCNSDVAYAYGIVENADLVTIEDRLILHALGVAWL